MPKLVNSFLRLETGDKEARAKVKEFLVERGHTSSDVREIKLELLPRYFFEYSVTSHGENEEKKIVSDFSIGKGFFNPLIKEMAIDPGYAKENLSNEFPDRIEFEVVKSALAKNDAEKIVTALLSKEKKIVRESIDFLHFDLFFVPMWNLKLDCHSKLFELEVNAFTGTVCPISKIEEQQKAWGSAAADAIKDLKKPANWGAYFKDALHTFWAFLTHPSWKKLVHALLHDHNLQLIVLLVILSVLLYSAFG